MAGTMLAEATAIKGDLPGHPFRGNQWSGGGGGSFAEMSLDEAEAIYEATESWIGKLDSDVADVVDDYIGDGHRQLNHNLRQGPEALSKEDKQTAKTIDDAMGPLQGDAVLFRGVDKNTWDDLYAGLKPGDSVRDRAFVSTSLEKKTADKFASGGTVEIAAPKGTMCLPVAGIGEMEILLPRGMEMKVVAVDHERKVISVVPVSQGSRQPPGNPSEGWDFGKLQKSPSRLTIAKHLLSVATQAVQLKRLLLKDQLRNAVVKAVHVKQYAETEAELAEAVSGLIKRQFTEAGRKLGQTKGELELVEKGDLPGHPFRGNQWSGGRSSRLTQDSFKTDDADTTERVHRLAAKRVAENWDCSDDDIRSLLKEEGWNKLTEYSGSELKEKAALAYIELWGSSSGFPVSVMAMASVAKDQGRDFTLYDDQKSVVEWFEKNPGQERAAGSLGRAIYATTQDWLRERGIENIDLFRSGAKGDPSASGRVMSSWSISESGTRSGNLELIRSSIPVKDVFSVPGTGFGTLMESEVVVLPNKGRKYEVIGNKSPSFTSTKSPSVDIFDPRSWDRDLIDTCLPVLMKHAGEAAAAQMLIMGVDVAPKRRRGTKRRDGVHRGPISTPNYHRIWQQIREGKRRCQRCGAGADTVLIVHHVDGDGSNDDRCNLQVLCDACHRAMPDGPHTHPAGEERGIENLQTKASRATEWLLALEDDGEDLSPLWPEVFALPGGGTVDLGFATEWPDWMKAEITKQMQDCFAQPFWAGINDTTASGIQSHVLKGLEEGLSIREIQQMMVGDGLDEYYRNRGQNIARTEAGNALNGARSAAMDRLSEEVPGLKTKKTWMSVLGTTTRDSHAALDGVPADRNGEWYLGGVKIPWPAHWRLPPSERCSCQCTLVQSWGMPDSEAEQLIEDYNRRLAEERAARDFWTKHLAGRHDQSSHGRGGSVLQNHVSEMISHLETIFKGPGRAAAVNEVLSAAKFPEYLKGILQETPGADEIRAVVEWSVRRGRMWEAA